MDGATSHPERVRLSPYTGMVRADWVTAADALLRGAMVHASPGHALVHLPGGRPSASGTWSDGFEGFARTFVLAALRLASGDAEAPGDLAERYAAGVVAGTTPAGPEAWPPVGHLNQPLVEAAAVAVALHESRPWVWDRLSAAEQEQVVGWLSQVHGRRYHLSNWLLFRVAVDSFLASVGAPVREDEVVRALDLVESWYRAGGWYSDGPGESFDHYCGWGVHLWLALWCHMGGGARDPDRAGRVRERLRRWLADAWHLVGGDGAPLHHGRSLIYRWAAAAPFWAGALVDATPLPPGATRRVASGMLRYFLDRGAVRDGVLTMGWHGQHLPTAQGYSGPGSPYWAAFGFLGLLLPADHPVWVATEEPLPVERATFIRPMPAPGFVAHGTQADGIVRVSSHRSHHQPSLVAHDPHYDRLAYATAAGPDVVGGADNQAVVLGAGGPLPGRQVFQHLGVAGPFAGSVWYPAMGGVSGDRWVPGWARRVETVSIAWRGGELRVHHVSAPGRVGVADAGYAVATSAGAGPEGHSGDGWAVARDPVRGVTSAVAALAGFGEAGLRGAPEGVNAYGDRSLTPWLRTPLLPGPEVVAVSRVVLTGEDLDAAALDANVEEVRVDGRLVTISCSEGEAFLVQLVEPEELDVGVAGHRLRGPVRWAHANAAGVQVAWPQAGVVS